MVENEFEPRLGRMRAGGGKRARRYLQRVIAATNLARGAGAILYPAQRFDGARLGRGASAGCVLASRPRRAGFERRRVLVKARIVRLAAKGAAGAVAHLRYLQRDGTTRTGDPGRLYDAGSDHADAATFHARGSGDRHQFRFIVSPEDGADYDDLKPLVRRLMERAAEDLGTPLDWVAVDHFNTGHPHSHIIVRGKDHRGADLVVARDYLSRGLRERAGELVELDLGPRTARDAAHALRVEVEQERLTSLDRALLADAGPDHVVGAAALAPLAQTLRAGRLGKLASLGLAEPTGGGRYRLDPELEVTLRKLGERGDIIREMQRAFIATEVARAKPDRIIYDPAGNDAAPLVGRVRRRGLADEDRDRHYLVVDALDGRSHYVALGGEAASDVGEGAIVRIEPHRTGLRPADRIVAEVAAAHGGRYDIDAHLTHDRAASQAFAEAHVRRLEALRRARVVGVTREPDGSWRLPDDYLARVEAHERGRVRDRPVVVTLLTRQSLDEQLRARGATWLDDRIADGMTEPAHDAGFGREVRAAETRRRQWLIAQGLAEPVPAGVACRPDMLATLRRRDLLALATRLSGELGKGFSEAADGEHVAGVLARRVEIPGGSYALVERARDFTLVPWRPVLEPRVGQSVSGLVRGAGISWTFGRTRGGPMIE